MFVKSVSSISFIPSVKKRFTKKNSARFNTLSGKARPSLSGRKTTRIFDATGNKRSRIAAYRHRKPKRSYMSFWEKVKYNQKLRFLRFKSQGFHKKLLNRNNKRFFLKKSFVVINPLFEAFRVVANFGQTNYCLRTLNLIKTTARFFGGPLHPLNFNEIFYFNEFLYATSVDGFLLTFRFGSRNLFRQWLRFVGRANISIGPYNLEPVLGLHESLVFVLKSIKESLGLQFSSIKTKKSLFSFDKKFYGLFLPTSWNLKTNSYLKILPHKRKGYGRTSVIKKNTTVGISKLIRFLYSVYKKRIARDKIKDFVSIAIVAAQKGSRRRRQSEKINLKRFSLLTKNARLLFKMRFKKLFRKLYLVLFYNRIRHLKSIGRSAKFRRRGQLTNLDRFFAIRREKRRVVEDIKYVFRCRDRKFWSQLDAFAKSKLYRKLIQGKPMFRRRTLRRRFKKKKHRRVVIRLLHKKSQRRFRLTNLQQKQTAVVNKFKPKRLPGGGRLVSTGFQKHVYRQLRRRCFRLYSLKQKIRVLNLVHGSSSKRKIKTFRRDCARKTVLLLKKFVIFKSKSERFLTRRGVVIFKWMQSLGSLTRRFLRKRFSFSFLKFSSANESRIAAGALLEFVKRRGRFKFIKAILNKKSLNNGAILCPSILNSLITPLNFSHLLSNHFTWYNSIKTFYAPLNSSFSTENGEGLLDSDNYYSIFENFLLFRQFRFSFKLINRIHKQSLYKWKAFTKKQTLRQAKKHTALLNLGSWSTFSPKKIFKLSHVGRLYSKSYLFSRLKGDHFLKRFFRVSNKRLKSTRRNLTKSLSGVKKLRFLKVPKVVKKLSYKNSVSISAFSSKRGGRSRYLKKHFKKKYLLLNKYFRSSKRFFKYQGLALTVLKRHVLKRQMVGLISSTIANADIRKNRRLGVRSTRLYLKEQQKLNGLLLSDKNAKKLDGKINNNNTTVIFARWWQKARQKFLFIYFMFRLQCLRLKKLTFLNLSRVSVLRKHYRYLFGFFRQLCSFTKAGVGLTIDKHYTSALVFVKNRLTSTGGFLRSLTLLKKSQNLNTTKSLRRLSDTFNSRLRLYFKFFLLKNKVHYTSRSAARLSGFNNLSPYHYRIPRTKFVPESYRALYAVKLPIRRPIVKAFSKLRRLSQIIRKRGSVMRRKFKQIGVLSKTDNSRNPPSPSLLLQKSLKISTYRSSGVYRYKHQNFFKRKVKPHVTARFKPNCFVNKLLIPILGYNVSHFDYLLKKSKSNPFKIKRIRLKKKSFFLGSEFKKKILAERSASILSLPSRIVSFFAAPSNDSPQFLKFGYGFLKNNPTRAGGLLKQVMLSTKRLMFKHGGALAFNNLRFQYFSKQLHKEMLKLGVIKQLFISTPEINISSLFAKRKFLAKLLLTVLDKQAVSNSLSLNGLLMKKLFYTPLNLLGSWEPKGYLSGDSFVKSEALLTPAKMKIQEDLELKEKLLSDIVKEKERISKLSRKEKKKARRKLSKKKKKHFKLINKPYVESIPYRIRQFLLKQMPHVSLEKEQTSSVVLVNSFLVKRKAISKFFRAGVRSLWAAYSLRFLKTGLNLSYNLSWLNFNNINVGAFSFNSSKMLAELAKRNATLLVIKLFNRRNRLAFLYELKSLMPEELGGEDLSLPDDSSAVSIKEPLIEYRSSDDEGNKVMDFTDFAESLVGALRSIRRLELAFSLRMHSVGDFGFWLCLKLKSWFRSVNSETGKFIKNQAGGFSAFKKPLIFNNNFFLRKKIIYKVSSLSNYCLQGRVRINSLNRLTLKKKHHFPLIARNKREMMFIKIFISLNNAFVTLTNVSGQPFTAWSSGSVGFRGPAKLTTASLDRLSDKILEFSKKIKLTDFNLIFTSGPMGNFAKHFLSSLAQPYSSIYSVSFFGNIPHNGVRSRRQKRR